LQILPLLMTLMLAGASVILFARSRKPHHGIGQSNAARATPRCCEQSTPRNQSLVSQQTLSFRVMPIYSPGAGPWAAVKKLLSNAIKDNYH